MKANFMNTSGGTVALAVALAAALAAPTAGFARGGGGTTTNTTADFMPTTPPELGILLRESFGFGLTMESPQRPAGGKGFIRPVFASRPITDYWLEYPASSATRWINSGSGQTWRFAGCSDNPNELPSPLQTAPPTGPGNGCVVSEWTDTAISTSPAALMPFNAALASAPFQASIDGYPAPRRGAYLAVGLTAAGTPYSNLSTGGSVWLALLPGVAAPDGSTGPLRYQLRLRGQFGPVLASGETSDQGFNQLAVGYDPVAKTVSATVNGAAVGPFPVNALQDTAIRASRYAGFEGEGLADNFMVMSTSP